MGLVSLQADINERRLENGAAIVFEDQYPVRRRQKPSRYDPQLVAAATSLDITPEALFELRKWVRGVTKECNERLTREKVMVYTLTEGMERVTAKDYLPKMDASNKYPIIGGDLLDLDDLYEGMLVRRGYIYLSEAAFERGMSQYGPLEILSGLIEERCAA